MFSIGSLLAPAATAARAARLFCTPQRPGADKLKPVSNGPQPEVTVRSFSSGALRTYTWGDPASQPTAVLVHGWNGWAFQLAGLVPILLERGLAVVAIDHVGHGGSAGRLAGMPSFIRSLREVLATYPRISHVVAHSFGAAAAVLVLAETGARPRTVLLAPPRNLRVFLDQFARAFGLSARMADLMQAWIEQHFRTTFDEIDADRVAPRVQAPTLLIHDRADRVVPFAHGARYAARIPGVHLHPLQDVGHTQMLRAPEVLDRIAAFLFDVQTKDGEIEKELVEA